MFWEEEIVKGVTDEKYKADRFKIRKGRQNGVSNY